MDQKILKNQSKVELTVTVTADTYESILRVCEKRHCIPGRYIDRLVAHDQHLYPQECLEIEQELMLLDAAADYSPAEDSPYVVDNGYEDGSD